MIKTVPQRLVIALLGFTLLAITASANASKAYDFPGKYKGRSAQGMAIHGDFAFLLNDHGHCRVYDLPGRRLVREFDLASAGPHNHANCASFGIEYPEGNTRFPALYVAQCRDERVCFVESVGDDGPRLIQTIHLKTGTAAERCYDWVVDQEQKCIYTLATEARDIDKNGTNRVLITKFSLPSLKNPKVVFKKEDIIGQFTVEFPSVTQGATIRGGLLYMPVGLHDTPKWTGHKRARSREIIVVSLASQKIVKRLDLNAHVPEEPEDAAFHGDTLLVYAGQKGGLYKIDGI